MIGNEWDSILKEEYQKEYFQNLLNFIKKEYKEKTIYPKQNEVFNAFRYTDFSNVKVVILGQDPYHEKGQANGMAFAVNDNIPMPPSLKNIYQELENDLGFKPQGTTLVGWAKQGVLLLNTTLTVRESSAQSHSTFGWQVFTDAIIKECNKRAKPMVFILWGANAISKKQFISSHHLVLQSAHPSPLSAYRGFFGSKPFSKANEFLKKNGQTPIDWSKINDFKEEKPKYIPSPNDASYYMAKGKIMRV
jgi:uracil-DNA glycosylase